MSLKGLARSALSILRPIEVEGGPAPGAAALYARALREQSRSSTANGPVTQRRLFFLRGHPRSGTNWLGAVLNLHPAIICGGEFHLEAVRRAIDNLQHQTWHLAGQEPLRTVLDECYADLVRRCMLTLVPEKPGATWIGDRTPRELSPMLPDGGAHHFLVVRDGRDVVVSWAYHLLRSEPKVIEAVVPAHLRPGFMATIYAHHDDPDFFKAHPEKLLADEKWVRFTSATWANRVRADARTAHRMEEIGPVGRGGGRVCRVRYETLHADPENERARLYRFLDLDPALAGPLSADDRTSPGFGREDARSFWRKGEVGDWKAYATDDFKRWFKAEAGAALIEQGYEQGDDW